MLMLAIESSARAASAALTENGILIAQYCQCSGLTHSRTLLPAVEDILKNSEHRPADLDVIAVAHGPGSFTGIRIGVAAAKGLAWALDKPVIGVSTLAAMAWHGQCAPEGSLICAAMDARRNQIYNALFKIDGGQPVRLCTDRAISLAELAEDVKNRGNLIFVVGDGAELCYNYLRKEDINCILAPEPLRLQSAWGVAMEAAGKKPVPVGELIPVYLRLSQAERERQQKMETENH